jgi:anti-sigma-K factor RskA
MSTRDHASYEEEIGAYLLGALTDLERQAFERHLSGCGECRDELERLRPAADLLPRSVEQVEPPPSLKASLMEIVERESRAGAEAKPESRRDSRRAPFWQRLAPRMGALVAAALLLGVAAGIGLGSLGGDGSRTVVATVDEARLPQASGTLKIEDDGDDGAILRVQGMPALEGERVYQAWVQRDGRVVPQPTFEVGEDGGGAVAVPDDLSDAEAVLVTREARGGARAPTEKPILSVPL